MLDDFVSLFFPRYCLACSGPLAKGEDLVCTNCIVEMPQTDDHVVADNALFSRLSFRIPIAHAMALFKFNKSGRVQQLLHQLKYKNHPEIGVMLGRVYGEKLVQANLASAFDIILPVPLHPSRKRKRGYNQSAKFAEGLSEKLGISFSDNVLVRQRKTETQTRKSKLNRWENMADVFRIVDQQQIVGKRILLVDDVITTGATIETCGHLLLGAGCASVSLACIAET
ncbi:ComF family protein [Chryseolinea sp. Jin1]|uniref:ComF family protein n=1 Tax=Chryseolinea lacunae TaxID=2801331 RepID=A0ABS1KQM6_9BACT|nr:ComF family protein [Chryseolinea lacunae]